MKTLSDVANRLDRLLADFDDLAEDGPDDIHSELVAIYRELNLAIIRAARPQPVDNSGLLRVHNDRNCMRF